MQHRHNDPDSRQLTAQDVAFATTEHYNLQTGRAMTIAEANGRASLFVGAVSSGLVALALVGQLSRLDTAFFVFSLVVLPTLLGMGLMTFERVLQAGKADLVYARGIARIRHLYLEHAPHLRPYLILPAHDESGEILRREAMHPSWAQTFFTMAGMIAMLNSVLAGGFAGLLLVALALPLWICAVAGVALFLASIVGHQLYQQGQWLRLERSLPAQFPGTPRQ